MLINLATANLTLVKCKRPKSSLNDSVSSWERNDFADKAELLSSAHFQHRSKAAEVFVRGSALKIVNIHKRPSNKRPGPKANSAREWD